MARVSPDITTRLLTHIKGNIVYLEAFGQPLILLNSPKSAMDLLEQRSAIYSDQPHLAGGSNSMVLYQINLELFAQEMAQIAHGDIKPDNFLFGTGEQDSPTGRV
jgi:hypothetical protein